MSTWRNIIISVMQDLQNSLQSQLSRILSSSATAQLTNQVKAFNTYERKIQNEIMAKSAQIVQLQNYLKSQIENIQTIIQENNQLKKQLEITQKELAIKNEVQKDLMKEVQNLGEMNRASNYIIKRLEERNLELQNQYDNKKLQQTFSQTQFCFPQDVNKSKKYVDISVNTNKNDFGMTSIRPEDQEKKLQLQAKVSELQSIIKQLKFQNNQLSLKLQCQQSPFNHSITQSSCEQLSQQSRKQTSQILSMVCDQILPQIKFKGQLLNGSKQGKGICQYEGNVYYEGYFKNNKRHGLGCLYAYDEAVYRGYWVQGLMEGKGLLRMLEGQIESYQGQFCGGKLQGYGFMKLKSGKRILAFWKDGKILGDCLQDSQKTKRLIKPELIQCY